MTTKTPRHREERILGERARHFYLLGALVPWWWSAFAQPKEGLAFDGSPVAHMWCSMIWPNNFF